MRMRTRLIIAAALGVLLTVAQCWLLALQAVPQAGSLWPATPGSTYEWPVEVPAGWPACKEMSRWHGIGLRRHQGENQNALSSRLADHFAWRDIIGWPMGAMESRRFEINSLTGTSSGPPKVAFDSGIEVSIGGGPNVRRCYLPLRPSPLGFMVNASLHGLVAWLLLGGAHALRRAHRRSRGRCVRCGYDLAGLPTCAECGASAQAAAV